ncbi:DUF5672 family protein [Ideonella sp. BN130291]|uniref:DUF5672 family protein n=1 Tax=Ideonella sp. BN130291 TaxID=3112940 RepID=UPI002E25D6B4|nr:DUF5672 family protein [Ideonella sp. BN130291]
MLELPQVTLCCVDTRTPQLALAALARCTAGIRFAEVLLFTDTRVCRQAPPGVRLVDMRIESVAAYSEFMLRGITPHIATSHWLIVQWDGFVLDASAWRPEFLDHDYIGAPWPKVEGERAVGNGGFSLRSRRLLQALQDPEIVVSHPEDVCICQLNRDHLEQQHGIRFAPLALARHFAYERAKPNHPTFGVHGLFNFADVFSPEELLQLLRGLPDEMCRGLDAHDLAEELLRRGELDAAAVIIDKRKRLGMTDRRSWRLRLKHRLARWR